MSKIILTGTICTEIIRGTVGAKNTTFNKFLVIVTTGGNTNHRIANQAAKIKNSFFGITVFGKLAENAFSKGQTLHIDGRMEISDFQLQPNDSTKQAVIVTPEHITMLTGDVTHYAKAYNLMGNLVGNTAEVFNSTNMNIYKQKIAVNKRVGENDYSSFYNINFFGDRGEKLMSKDLLSKSKVKKILIDGTITATYNDVVKENVKKTYLNCEINVSDFQIAQYNSNSQSNGNSQNSNNSYGEPQAQNTENNTYNETRIPDIEIDEDEIPF